MTELKGTNVAATVVPFTSDDKYATHDAAYGKGGFRSVATITERDAIPVDRKTEGMVVRVQADKKHYVWESNAWAEWLPKGNVTVDTSLNINSNNAVSNKAVTTGINQVRDLANAAGELAGNANTTANAAIPKSKIAQTIGTDNSDKTDEVPSVKATYDTISAVNEYFASEDLRIENLAKAAKSTADAAIPKSKIAKEFSEIVITDTTQVPSSKALNDAMVDVATVLQAGIDSAQSTADAAIPKANISQSVSSSATRQDLVPSAKAVNDAITSAVNNIPKITVDFALSTTSVNPVQNKVITAKVNSLQADFNAVGQALADHILDFNNLSTDVTANHNAITDINTKLTPIKIAWDKKNAANGLVQLDAGGKLPAASLPAGYDNIDMLEAFVTANPTTGMTIGQKWYNSTTKKIFTATSTTAGSETTPEGNEKVYIDKNTNKSYRWTGSDMVVVGDGSGVALGTTASTAFRGDYGNTLYTNFGSGNNLTGTQGARDFFNKKTGKQFIQSITSSRNATQVQLGLSGYDFDGVSKNSSQLIPAADEGNAGVMTASMFKTLQELELQAFPLSMTCSIAGAATYEVGSSTTDHINIYVRRKGVLVNADATVTLTGSAGSTVNGSLSSNKQVWTPNGAVTAYAQKTFKAVYGSQEVTASAAWYFKYKKYWGVTDKDTLTNADVLALAGNAWADSRTMGATRFDCTGGKYPYYVIPASLYTGLEVWVGGLKNTDLVVTDMQVTNASGGVSAYKVIRLANKQTGVLSVEFK